jgi:hypothetical protein
MLAAATGSRDRDIHARFATSLTRSKNDWLTPSRNSEGNYQDLPVPSTPQREYAPQHWVGPAKLADGGRHLGDLQR